MSTYPRTFSHIGISVPDVEKAAKFYSEVMGWYHIMEPTVITEESDTPIGQMCIDVLARAGVPSKSRTCLLVTKLALKCLNLKTMKPRTIPSPLQFDR